MGIFERYLSVWVGISIIAGVILGNLFPNIFKQVAEIEFAHVNVLIAVCIWVMVYPMMVQVDFSSIKYLGERPKGLILTLVVNWLIKPFTMAGLGWLFFKILFADFVDQTTGTEYIAGMILLGVAPCTAMVFIWSQLTKGDSNYTLVQVSVNDVIMIFAFAPISGLLLGITDIDIPWKTLIFSVVLYVVLPLIAGVLTRFQFSSGGKPANMQNFLKNIKPISVLGLLLTVVLLFGLQAEIILDKPQIIGLIAIPLVLQTYGIFAITYSAARSLKLSHDIAAPACLIGTSNFFELAVAVAISLYGLNSGAALATVVGVLVEVPVMLSLVYFINRTNHLFPQKVS
ncbi:MAG: arsenical-resistance protein [Chloroflexi bacterium]|nr:arsenical-resistance protein [Chloroflexota bacterium]